MGVHDFNKKRNDKKKQIKEAISKKTETVSGEIKRYPYNVAMERFKRLRQVAFDREMSIKALIDESVDKNLKKYGY